jgi:predicted aspartyl protease
METREMGRVVCTVKVENLEDLWEVKNGRMDSADARHVEIDEALVDTGASTLSLPTRFIKKLGLQKVRERRVRTGNGPRDVSVYEPVRLTIQDRDCTVDVMEVDDDVPALIGQIPLELLDFVVDPAGQRLIGNPAHGGQWVWEMY